MHRARVFSLILFAVAPAIAETRKAPNLAKRAPSAAAVPASKLWHQSSGRAVPTDAQGRPLLVLQALNTQERLAVPALGAGGGFSAPDLDRAAHLLREPSTGNEHPIDPRLLDLVYRVASHFAAPELRIISGYRSPRSAKRTSNHARGRAIDLVVPGVSDEEVARFARDQGFCGVGVYPVSGFVHLDVRDHSFFWVDTSGPGKRNRTRGILPELAARSDARASARGEHGVPPFPVGGDVERALAASQQASATSPVDDEDTDDGPP